MDRSRLICDKPRVLELLKSLDKEMHVVSQPIVRCLRSAVRASNKIVPRVA